MAQIRVTLPGLVELMKDFKTKWLHGRDPLDGYEQIITYVFRSEKPTIQMIGRMSFDKVLVGTGNVMITGKYETFIYTGTWKENGEMLISSMDSDSFTFERGHLICRYQDKILHPELSSGFPVMVDDKYLRVKGTKVEFPIYPGLEMRILGPDGDYLLVDEELDMTEEEMKKNASFEECGFKIHKYSRSFVCADGNGTILHGHLIIQNDMQHIWWSSHVNDFDGEVEVKKEDFMNWLSGKAEERNLLCALNVTVPLVPVTPKEVKVTTPIPLP